MKTIDTYINMKHINTYILSKIKNKANITEKLKINKNQKTEHILFPSSKKRITRNDRTGNKSKW